MVEVLFENNTDTLRGECRFGKIAVVRLVVTFQTNLSGRSKKPLHVEVSYKVGVGHRIVPIAEVSVYK